MRKPARTLPALALGVAGVISTAAPSLAVPITYTETATASGILLGTMFSSAIVTLTMSNNTSNINTTQAPLYTITGTATVSVSGVNGGNPVDFTDMIQVFSDQNAVLGSGTVGFHDLTTGFDILDDSSAAFKTYALGPIGLVTGGTPTLGGTLCSVEFPVAGGEFCLSTVTTSASSPAFLATTAPEPASLALLGSALGYLALAGRRKKKPARISHTG